ncbi:MAG: hypothetical protein NTX66_01385 [Candidatus Falkowbacteria bacterium]|nr:hypothetical protein [Candidatus Falkowbacteria bacterium]
MESEKNKQAKDEFNNFTANPNRELDQNPLKILLAENLAISQEILDLAKYIKNYIRWQKIFGWLKVFLIVIPIVLGVLYLPAMLKNVLSSYGLNTTSNSYTNLLK